MKADLGCHKGKPKLVRPMNKLTEELRGVGDKDESERAEDEVLEETAGDEVEEWKQVLEGEVEEESSSKKSKNRRKRENKKAAIEEQRIQNEAFEEALDAYAEEMKEEAKELDAYAKEEENVCQEL